MIYLLSTLVTINLVFLYFLYKENHSEKNKSRIVQLLLESLFEYLFFINHAEYKNSTDKVYEKIQLYHYLIKKFEGQFGEQAWKDFFVKNQKANYHLFADHDYGMEPLRTIYLPFFILCLYREKSTQKDAEIIMNKSAVPLEILAEIKSIISHKKFNEIIG